jgi:hypothetical protein
MTNRADTLLAFVAAFEASIARHRHWLREPSLIVDLRDAALRGDARRVANFAREVTRLIRRERLWGLENRATARRQDARRQRFHDLAWGLRPQHEARRSA